jgi:hypothetical protein
MSGTMLFAALRRASDRGANGIEPLLRADVDRSIRSPDERIAVGKSELGAAVPGWSVPRL